MTVTEPLSCPLCGRPGEPDDRRPAEIAQLEFRSVTCELSPENLTDHPFPVRWLESRVDDEDELQLFKERFVYVRAPLEEGSAVAEAFGGVDPILAWIEHPVAEDGIRVLIRL